MSKLKAVCQQVRSVGRKVLKKIWYYLQLVDGVWSVPLGFFLFFMCGYVLSLFFGYTVGFYDPSFIQPLFLAATIVIGATNVAIGGLYFTFRGLYKYLYGGYYPDKKTGEKRRINYSKRDWLNLTIWQRFVIAFSVFFLFLAATIIVYLKLV